MVVHILDWVVAILLIVGLVMLGIRLNNTTKLLDDDGKSGYIIFCCLSFIGYCVATYYGDVVDLFPAIYEFFKGLDIKA